MLELPDGLSIIREKAGVYPGAYSKKQAALFTRAG